MCLTCSIAAGRISPPGGVVYRDDFVLLNHSMDVPIPGYVILSPLRHMEQLHRMTVDESVALAKVLRAVCAAVQSLDGVEKVYVASFGEDTGHVHFHIFPRYQWMLAEPAEEIFTGEKLDGAKLFSYMRKKYSRTEWQPYEAAVQDAIRHIKEGLEGDEC